MARIITGAIASKCFDNSRESSHPITNGCRTAESPKADIIEHDAHVRSNKHNSSTA